MKHKKKYQIYTLFIFVILFLGGCASVPVVPETNKTISVLTFLDHRPDKKLEFDDIDSEINLIKYIIPRKQYNLKIEKEIVIGSNDRDELELTIVGEETALLKEVQNIDTDYVLLFVLEHLERKYGLGATGIANYSGYLFKPNEGKVIWEGEAEGVGKMGVFLAALVDDMAREHALRNLLEKFPEHDSIEK